MKEGWRPLRTPPNLMIHPWTRNPTRARRARNAGCCSPRPRRWSWSGASVSSATCRARRGSSSPGSSAWPPHRWRSGSRITATRWRGAGLKADCRRWRCHSLPCYAGSWFRSWSGTGNLFTLAYWTRKKRAVCRRLQQHRSLWPTLLCSIHPPLRSPQGTSSTFTPRRPPGSPGETFGATRCILIPTDEELVWDGFKPLNVFQFRSNLKHFRLY